MTDRLDELQRLHEAATKGWRPGERCGTVYHDRDECVASDWIGGGGFWDDEDRALAIAARNALPALLRVARAAKHLRTAMTTPPKGYGDEHQGYWWTAATEKAAEEVAEAVQAMDAGGYAPKP